MSKSSAGIVLCEPIQLYNILVKLQGPKDPACLDETYLVLFDTRHVTAYFNDHIILARGARNGQQELHIPFDVHLPTVNHCIVYDSKTVSIIENTPALQFANILASSGSKNPVMVLKGGYERFSAEYPFLRTEKIIYTPRELQHLPHYPREILPLFLYIGEKRDAWNAALNYDLKITCHVVLGSELSPAFPGKIESLHIQSNENPSQDQLLPSQDQLPSASQPSQGQLPFKEICKFIERCWKKSGRVLIYEDTGCSASAVVATAYLIKKKNMKLKEASDHVDKYSSALPLRTYLDQLSQWEQQL